MSDPKSSDDPSRPSIADAASLFDSRVIYTYKPPESDSGSPEASVGASKPTPASDLDEYGLDLASSPPEVKPRAMPQVVKPTSSTKMPASAVSPTKSAKPASAAKPKAPASDRHFDPSDDDDFVVPAHPEPTGPAESAIRVERQSAHIDPESDSSDRAPSRSKRRSSDRAIGFEDADEGEPFEEGESGEVEQVWTRTAEWGPDLLRVGAVGLGTLALAWFSLPSIELTLLVLLVGGVATILLSYPLAITIERPVRITPEQAVKDFFAAASHHVPHYRRMWLLLSETARTSGRFASFEGFRTHWAGRMETWKEGRGHRFTPLTFKVSDFRAEKSVGQVTTQVKYDVMVFVRGEEAKKPIATYRMAHSVAKGSDRMWYLNQATLSSSGR